MSGWGAVCMNNTTGGLWRRDEKLQHINYLEMLAIFFGLRSFIKQNRKIHVRIYYDNTTAVMVTRALAIPQIEMICVNKYGNGVLIEIYSYLNVIFQEY